MSGQGEYQELLEKLEDQIEVAEKDFSKIKDEDAEGSLREKQEKAEKLIGEIHDQIEFLEERMEEIEQKD
ncbi:MAG: hypothetical protein ABEK01_04720 [Candidatus Nanohaloarchaea archaeon]